MYECYTTGKNHVLTRIYNSKYVFQTFQKLFCKLMDSSKLKLKKYSCEIVSVKTSKKDLGPIIKCYITNLDFTQNDKVIITVSGFFKSNLLQNRKLKSV